MERLCKTLFLFSRQKNVINEKLKLLFENNNLTYDEICLTPLLGTPSTSNKDTTKISDEMILRKI